MKPILEIKNISKRFRIQHEKQPYLSLRDSVTNFFSGKKNESNEDFWALEDVSFDVFPGESIGIIGKNGAGKSTLLKILSKITPPTSGKIISRGRLASLLEVGTGFHPELTGRENIFLNGSILGMKRKEIFSRFDEIIDFSGVEKFLDTPLKHYSSGMQLRLAFSVAAFWEPEILVIDEVLAVGDSVFQQKCVNKMNEVCKSGRTILFVSHNMAFVNALCTRGVFLENGKVTLIGQVESIISAYSAMLVGTQVNYDFLSVKRTVGAGKLLFDQVTFEKNPVRFGERIKIVIKLKTRGNDQHKNVDLAINISNSYNECLIHSCNRFTNTFFDHTDDHVQYTFEIDNILKPGHYILSFFIRTNDVIQDWLQNAAVLEILDGNPYGYADTGQIQGMIFPNFRISAHHSNPALVSAGLPDKAQ